MRGEPRRASEGRRFPFVTDWSVAESPETVWCRMTDALRTGRVPWWPAVRIGVPDVLVRGAVLRLTVRSPVGYHLRVTLTVTDLVPGRITADASGDLTGDGAVEILPASAGSIVRWRWNVDLTRPGMRRTQGVLAPVYRAAHTVVMRRGERGYRRLLDADRHRGSALRNAVNPRIPGDRAHPNR